MKDADDTSVAQDINSQGSVDPLQPQRLEHVSDEHLRQLYVQEDLTCKEIAERLSVELEVQTSTASVYRRLKECGVSMRQQPRMGCVGKIKSADDIETIHDLLEMANSATAQEWPDKPTKNEIAQQYGISRNALHRIETGKSYHTMKRAASR